MKRSAYVRSPPNFVRTSTSVLVNRSGDQFAHCTVSFHAPDAGDAGVQKTKVNSQK